MEHGNDGAKRAEVHGMCGMMAGYRQGMPWCGIFFLLAGLLWLIVRSGWLAADLFWPVLMVMIGTWMVLPPLWRRMVHGTDEPIK
jgi:hypothetical protein